MKTICCVLALFALGETQVIGRGRCPQTQVLQNFDVTRYLGKWFEIAKYPNLFQRGTCAEALYGPISNDGKMKVVNKEISNNGQVRAVGGYGQMKVFGRGDLLVTLRTPVVGEAQSNYDVLGTDYNNWALVHACREILGVKAEFAWILSRNKQLSANDQQQIETLIAYNGLNLASFQNTNQFDCPTDVDDLPFSFIAK